MAMHEGAMRGEQHSGSVYSGWTTGFVFFAGALMIVSGMFQIFQGLAAIFEDEFFVIGRSYAFDLDVTAWGWTHFITGIIMVLAGFYVFTGNLAARMVGIVLASISAFFNFLYIPYYPVWSILIIAVDIGIIWALAVYNGPEEKAGNRI